MSDGVFPLYAVEHLKIKVNFEQRDCSLVRLSLVSLIIKTEQEVDPSGKENLTVMFQDKIFYLQGSSKGSILADDGYLTEFSLYFDNVSTFKTWQTLVKVIHRAKLKKLIQKCQLR